MEYRVLRQHYGDKEYREGDKREMPESAAKSLVKMGLLEEIKQKKAPAPENKQAPAPENKSRKSPKNK